MCATLAPVFGLVNKRGAVMVGIGIERESITGELIVPTYGCGCGHTAQTNMMVFCDNPKHTMKSCGCYHHGSYSSFCAKHMIVYFMIMVIVVFAAWTAIGSI